MQEQIDRHQERFEDNLLGLARVYGLTKEKIRNRADEIYEKKWGSKTEDSLKLSSDEFDDRVNAALSMAFDDLIGPIGVRLTQPSFTSRRYWLDKLFTAVTVVGVSGLTIAGMAAITRSAGNKATEGGEQAGEEHVEGGDNISPFDTNQDVTASGRPRKIM